MGKGYRVFSPEYKKEALRLGREQGKTDASLARELGINRNTLRNWRRALAKGGEIDGTGTQTQSQGEARVRELEQENARLRQEREILKKVLSIVTQPSDRSML
jgi:transposase